MVGILLALLGLAAPQAPPVLGPGVRERFSIGLAHPILSVGSLGPQARRVADRALNAGRVGAPRCFVSEDGKAVGELSGRIDKFGTDPPGLLADWDTYRVLLDGSHLTPYNVSQETHLSPGPRDRLSVSLMPLVAMDRYRTLCARGASASAGEYVPRRSLLLGIIDDRQRGPKPNVGRRVPMRGDVGFPWVQAVRGEWYLLGVLEGGRRAYVEVNGRTLATRRAHAPARTHWQTDDDVRRAYPDHEFVPQSVARWAGRTYYTAHFNPKGHPSRSPVAAVWDGKSLTPTEPWTIVASSLNGRFGWFVNRETGQSWLITPKP
ncbi:MAG: hypothetical protein FJX72_14085 [Armatimonadetes bacterium]|nr:hypothetical protein [Armatimonadota bacterium]